MSCHFYYLSFSPIDQDSHLFRCSGKCINFYIFDDFSSFVVKGIINSTFVVKGSVSQFWIRTEIICSSVVNLAKAIYLCRIPSPSSAMHRASPRILPYAVQKTTLNRVEKCFLQIKKKKCIRRFSITDLWVNRRAKIVNNRS